MKTTHASGDVAQSREVMVLRAEDIDSVLSGREVDVVAVIRNAYEAHARGESSLPPSSFLRFPEDPANRIIALPAYLGGSAGGVGIKWIASFPANLDAGLDRASAVLILNSAGTGRPKAILEGSIISAKRTAASAALAASVIHPRDCDAAVLVGCGVINFEIARFLSTVIPQIKNLVLYDLDPDRAYEFKRRCETQLSDCTLRVARNAREALDGAALVSLATTAGEPYLDDLNLCAPGAVILNVSLRDLSVRVILSSDNVVDDIDHVCRANTSVHLAEQTVGHRRFLRCTLGEILTGRATARRDTSSLVVFSPFGLGILDVALGEYVLQRARAEGKGVAIPGFMPKPWNRTVECATQAGLL